MSHAGNLYKLIKSYRLSHVIIVAALAAIFLTISTAVSAHAAPIQGLTISPLRTQLTITPGTVQTAEINLYNTTSSDMTIAMSAELFSVTDQQYDYLFNPNSPVAGWVRFDMSSVTLASGKSKIINYSINVPASAEPGDRYISLFATTSIKGDNNTASSTERVGSLVYITISGNISRMGYVISLFTPWTMIGTSTWSATLRDSGTSRFTSDYTMGVKTLWNTDVSSSSGSSLILAKTIRLIQGNIAEPKVPGIYKLVFTTTLGDSPDVKLVSYILYMPIYGWIVVIVGLTLGISKVRQVIQKRHDKAEKTM